MGTHGGAPRGIRLIVSASGRRGGAMVLDPGAESARQVPDVFKTSLAQVLNHRGAADAVGAVDHQLRSRIAQRRMPVDLSGHLPHWNGHGARKSTPGSFAGLANVEYQECIQATYQTIGCDFRNSVPGLFRVCGVIIHRGQCTANRANGRQRAPAGSSETLVAAAARCVMLVAFESSRRRGIEQPDGGKNDECLQGPQSAGSMTGLG